MKLTRKELRQLIVEATQSNINESQDFNPHYRAEQMMKGGGRVMMAIKDPNDYRYFVYNEETDEEERDEGLFEIYMAFQNADTIANRLRTGDSAEALRIGTHSLPMFQKIEPILRGDLRPKNAGGLRYVISMVEGSAAYIFLTRLIGIIQQMQTQA